MTSKPRFDPSKPFEVAQNLGEKPKFDPSSPFQVQANQDQASMTGSAVRKFAQGATANFSDEGAGLFEAGGRALGFEGVGGPMKDIRLSEYGPTTDWEVIKDAYIRGRNKERATLAKDAKDNPKISAVAELTGAVASPVNKVAQGASMAQGAARIGAITGAGMSEADNVADLVSDTGKGMVTGAVVGKGAELLSPVAGKAVSKIGEKSKDLAERLAARALGAERATVKRLGPEKVKEIGRYALDEGILSPLATTDDLISRNAAKQAQGSSKMERVYSAIDDANASTFNPREVAQKVDEKIGNFYRSPINRGETKQLDNTIDSILMRVGSDTEAISLKEAQALKEEIGKVANWKNKVNITDKEKMARDAYGVVSSAIDDATEAGAKSINSKELGKTLNEGKKLFSRSKGAEELLENKQAREEGNKLLGITDWSLLGAGGAASVATGGAGVVPTLAALGAKKAGEKYGAQTSALVLDKIGKAFVKSKAIESLAEKNPAALQIFFQKFEGNQGSIPKAAEKDKNNPGKPVALKGYDKWTLEGLDKISSHDQTGVMSDPAVIEGLMSSSKGKSLLISASDLKPGSKAMDKVLSQIKSQYGKDKN